MTFDLLRDASTNERKEIDLKFAKCASPQETGWYSIIENRGKKGWWWSEWARGSALIYKWE